MTLRAKVWPKLDAFVKLLRQSQSDEMYYEKFRMAVTEFTQLMVKAWGETHITHYIVIIFLLTYFVDVMCEYYF